MSDRCADVASAYAKAGVLIGTSAVVILGVSLVAVSSTVGAGVAGYGLSGSLALAAKTLDIPIGVTVSDMAIAGAMSSAVWGGFIGGLFGGAKLIHCVIGTSTKQLEYLNTDEFKEKLKDKARQLLNAVPGPSTMIINATTAAEWVASVSQEILKAIVNIIGPMARFTYRAMDILIRAVYRLTRDLLKRQLNFVCALTEKVIDLLQQAGFYERSEAVRRINTDALQGTVPTCDLCGENPITGGQGNRVNCRVQGCRKSRHLSCYATIIGAREEDIKNIPFSCSAHQESSQPIGNSHATARSEIQQLEQPPQPTPPEGEGGGRTTAQTRKRRSDGEQVIVIGDSEEEGAEGASRQSQPKRLKQEEGEQATGVLVYIKKENTSE